MRNTTRLLTVAMALGWIVSFCLPPAAAITIPYGNFEGTDVWYLNVTEDTRDEPTALFGSPDIQGNTLDFDPLSFFASVSSATGTSSSEIVDGQLNFTVSSKSDSFAIDMVKFREAGDYGLTGLGTALAQVTVSAPVRWTITHVGGSPLANPLSGSDLMTFTPASVFSLPSTGGVWNGSLDVNVAQFLVDNGVSGPATKIEFVLDNTLTAAAFDGGSAFIAKKDFNGVTIIIPEPGSLSLLLCACLGLLSLTRQR